MYTLNLFPVKELEYAIRIQILDEEFSEYKNYFFKSVIISDQPYTRAELGEPKIFLSVIKNSAKINIPYNVMPIINDEYAK